MNPAHVFEKIAPELLAVVERRYLILRTVFYMSPIGRRTVARQLALSERTIRNDIEFLRERNFLVSDVSGMYLSPGGEELLMELKECIRQIHGLSSLERDLTEVLGIDQVIVIPGDSDQDPVVKSDLARATARFLRKILQDGDILAVTGGTTLNQVASFFPTESSPRQVTVVPARGGLGEDVNIQANSIAARLAAKLGGHYRLLHAPDQVEPSLVETIMNEPKIRDVIALMRRAQVLLHGIGTAEEMARRRGFDDERLMQLIADGAVGEAFGYYFDAQGRIVYSTSSVGLRLEDLEKIPMVVAVGGGKSKAWAVLSVMSTGYCDVCITDEGAARRLISISKNKKGGSRNGN